MHGRIRSHRRAAAALLAAVALAQLAGCGGGSGAPRTTTQQLTPNELNTTPRSSVSVDGASLRSGVYAAHAAIGPDANGTNTYARAVWNVSWREGDTVHYSARFRLPRGFLAAMQGEVDLMRWDNFGDDPSCEDAGGLVIFNEDKALHVVLWPCTGGGGSLITGPMPTEDTWHTLEVRQTFSSSSPRSELYVDGVRAGLSSMPNFHRLPIDRLRFGIVGITAGAQRNPLRLSFADPQFGVGV